MFTCAITVAATQKKNDRLYKKYSLKSELHTGLRVACAAACTWLTD